MKTITTSFELGCTPDIYWSLLLGADYLTGLYQRLGFREMTILELSDTSRKMRLRPARNLPGVLDRVVGDKLVYEHVGTLDRAKNLFTWHMVPPHLLEASLKARIDTRGTTRLEPAGQGWRCVETVQLEAHMFGLGGLIESTIEKELRASWRSEIDFLHEWLARHP